MDVARRMSSIVSGKNDKVFAPTIGNEAQLANLGYQQGKSALMPPIASSRIQSVPQWMIYTILRELVTLQLVCLTSYIHITSTIPLDSVIQLSKICVYNING